MADCSFSCRKNKFNIDCILPSSYYYFLFSFFSFLLAAGFQKTSNQFSAVFAASIANSLYILMPSTMEYCHKAIMLSKWEKFVSKVLLILSSTSFRCRCASSPCAVTVGIKLLLSCGSGVSLYTLNFCISAVLLIITELPVNVISDFGMSNLTSLRFAENYN